MHQELGTHVGKGGHGLAQRTACQETALVSPTRNSPEGAGPCPSRLPANQHITNPLVLRK